MIYPAGSQICTVDRLPGGGSLPQIRSGEINMNTSSLETAINDAWEQRESINGVTSGEIREAVDAALDALDTGEQRVAENGSEGWTVNQWLKKAVM